MNYEAIKQAAEGYKADMAKFLRDMIAIPSESCEEEGVVKRIAEELTKLGYNKVVKVATFLGNKRMVIKEGKNYILNPECR